MASRSVNSSKDEVVLVRCKVAFFKLVGELVDKVLLIRFSERYAFKHMWL